MIEQPYGEKNYDDMLSRFHLISERYGRTDGQTDGKTLHHSKDRAYSSHRAVKTMTIC